MRNFEKPHLFVPAEYAGPGGAPISIFPALQHAINREGGDPVVAASDLFGLGLGLAHALVVALGYDVRPLSRRDTLPEWPSSSPGPTPELAPARRLTK